MHGLSSWNWSLAEDLAFYRSRGIGLATVPFMKLEPGVADGVAAIRAEGVRAAGVSGGGATPLLGGLEVLRAPLDAAAALSAPVFYSITGGYPTERPPGEAYAALAEAVAPVLAHAQAQGVRVAIENSSIARREQGFVHTLADTAAVARETGLDICLELQNVWYERDLPRLFRENVDRFALVQVSDFVTGGVIPLNRCVPGDGEIPLEWLMRQLLDAGYTGVFDLELMGPAIEEEGYASAIGRAVDWLSERLTRWGA